MTDYYKILGISRNATLAQIRHAYREKVKKLHPDISKADTTEEFKEVIKAFEILKDEKSRSIFDESLIFKNFHQETQKKKKFNYREWLLNRNDDLSKATLIIYDLMHGREEDAVKEYKQMNMENADYRLSRFLDPRDFMDLGYILAEELVLRQEYYDAAILLDQIIRMDRKYNYFKIFQPEVISLARHILRNNIDALPPELAIDTWERALDLELSSEDDKIFLMKMAEAYEKIGDMETASICREEAAKIKNK